MEYQQLWRAKPVSLDLLIQFQQIRSILIRSGPQFASGPQIDFLPEVGTKFEKLFWPRPLLRPLLADRCPGPKDLIFEVRNKIFPSCHVFFTFVHVLTNFLHLLLFYPISYLCPYFAGCGIETVNVRFGRNEFVSDQIFDHNKIGRGAHNFNFNSCAYYFEKIFNTEEMKKNI